MHRTHGRIAGTHASILTGALCAAAIFSGGCASAQRAPFGPVIEADQLVQRLAENTADPRLIVLDVRDATAYDAGHIAGAVRLDARQWKDESLAADTGLSHEAAWRERIGAAGVNGREPVVIYGDGRMTEAARIWFIFQHFGVERVAVLNGGYPALKPLIDNGSLKLSTSPSAPTPVAFHPEETASGTIGLVDRERVRESAEQNDAQILDTRSPDEYVGKAKLKNPRGGHVPTAINLPHKEFLDEHSRLKSPGELAKILKDAGFKPGHPVITYCQSGGRASLAALAAERAGYGPVQDYYQSFGDWSADDTCPLEQ